MLNHFVAQGVFRSVCDLSVPYDSRNMVYLRRRPIPVPQELGLGADYFLVLRERMKVTPCPDGSSFITEFDVKRKLRDQRYAARVGREFGKPLALTPQLDRKYGRYDLRLDRGAGRTSGQRKEQYYHRVLALTCLTSRYDCKGRRLVFDVLVRGGMCSKYQVDHRDWNNLDCRLRNLQLLPIGRHTGYERFDWSKKVLKTSVKKAKIRRVLDDPAAMRLR